MRRTAARSVAGSRLALLLPMLLALTPVPARAGLFDRPIIELVSRAALQLFEVVGQTATRLLGREETSTATKAADGAVGALATQNEERLATRRLQEALAAADTATAPAGIQLQLLAGMDLSAPRLALLHRLRSALHRPPRVVFASNPARDFGQDFHRGARDSAALLGALRQRQSAWLDPWLQAPPGQRVFIIGTSRDGPAIGQLQQTMEREGFVTFFFSDCAARLGVLCSSAEVGAFFASAGHAIVVQSPQATASGFIPVEVATAGVLAGGGLLWVCSPDQVLQAGLHAASQRATEPLAGSVLPHGDAASATVGTARATLAAVPNLVPVVVLDLPADRATP